MKIALASAPFENNNIPYNLSQLEQFARRAAGMGAQLVCFGETFVQGFDSLCWKYEQDSEVALSLSSPTMQKLCQLSDEVGIDLLFDYIEWEDDRLYSSCALIQDGKILQNYRRLSRGWKEFRITDEHYCEGDVAQPFLYRGRRCLIALCGDLWDLPERFDCGEEILFWPVYVNFKQSDWQDSVRASYIQQAAKIPCDVLLINSLSKNPDAFGGCYHFRSGAVLDALEYGNEGLLVVEL